MKMAEDDLSSVRVAVRIRPQLAREKIEGCRICTYVTPGEPQVTLQDKAFTYDNVFDTPTEQCAIYDKCIKSLVDGCFEGYNATVLAYGQTGSGKTYTMGTGFDVTTSPEELGVIPRAMDHLFAEITRRKQSALNSGYPPPEFQVSAQFVELYNEEIIDLFDTTRSANKGKSNIRIHEDANGNIYTVGVTTQPVATAEETLKCLHSGALNRTTAATQMNSQSSRSHAIFSIHMKQTRVCKTKTSNTDKENASTYDSESTAGSEPVSESEANFEFETLSAKFHFTDLAGSERLKRTGATGDRAKEGISINCGLLSLGNVISALGDVNKKGSHVPYRDSKLTRLLQDSLGGNSCTLMIACVSPSDSEFVETLNTLKYANRARNIKNKVSANQDSASKQVQALRQQIAALQVELTEYKTGKRIVGEDGVEAYNDMFQENSMLQKEIDNFRLKIKAMQSTIDAQNQRIVNLTAEIAQSKIANGAGGDGDNDALSMIKTYINEIEELRAKLVESEALCSTLRRKSDTASPFTRIFSPRPVPMTASVDFESPVVASGKAVLELAKGNIQQLEQEKMKLKQQARSDKKEETKTEENSAQNGQGDSGLNGHGSDHSASENDTEASEADDEAAATSEDDELGDDDELPESIQNQFATLTYEIDIKQQLVNQLESMQSRLSSMQRQYEEKLRNMSDKIKAVEVERDKVLNNMSANKTSEQESKVRAQYKKQIDDLKKEKAKLMEAKRSHDRLVREQSRHMNQLRALRQELDQMKKAKVRLLRQMKDEQKRNKTHESKQMREIMRLKREYRQKANKLQSLETQSKKKDMLMKRKQEEVVLLRRQLKPISGSFGKRHQQQQKAAKHVNQTPLDATFVVDKASTSSSPQESNSNTKRDRKLSSEFSSRTARVKWKTVQKKVDEVVLQRETIARIEKQMERFIKDRERLKRDIELLHRKRTRAAVKGESLAVCHQLKDEEDTLQENIDYVNEQIQECQMEIMQVEESMEDNGMVTGVIQTCSVNEARYMLENLLAMAINKSAVTVQSQSKLEDLQSKLSESQQSAKQAHDIMRYMLEEKPNLDASLIDCLSEYMKGNSSDTSSLSSRDSSPDRQDHSFEALPTSALATLGHDAADGREDSKPKELKARRRTATPQELLHGMASPIQNLHLRIKAPIHEEAIMVDGVPTPGMSTPENRQSPNDTITNETVGSNALHGMNDDEVVQKKRLGTYALDVDVQPSAEEKISSPSETTMSSVASDPPPGSPLSTSRSSQSTNVFSRLTTFAVSSPRYKGRMHPYTSKTPTPRSAPLICVQVAEGHHKPVLSVQATDHLLFSASKDRSVKVWNLVTGQEIMSLDGHPNNVNIVRHCPHTGLVYSVSLCYIKIWDIRSRAKCIRVLSTSGAHHMPSGFMGNLQRTNKMPENEFQINDVKLSPDSKHLYCAASTYVKIWDLNKFAVMGKLSGHTGNIMTMAIPKGETTSVVTGGKDHFIKVYDLTNGFQGIISPSTTLEPPHMDGVESLVFSSTSNVMFSASRDKSIKKWDMKAKSVIKSQYQAHANWVCALDLVRSDDGDEVLVSGGRGGVVKLWDVESFGAIGDLQAHSSTVNCIASNNSHIFTASSDATIKVWKTKPDR